MPSFPWPGCDCNVRRWSYLWFSLSIAWIFHFLRADTCFRWISMEVDAIQIGRSVAICVCSLRVAINQKKTRVDFGLGHMFHRYVYNIGLWNIFNPKNIPTGKRDFFLGHMFFDAKDFEVKRRTCTSSYGLNHIIRNPSVSSKSWHETILHHVVAIVLLCSLHLF